MLLSENPGNTKDILEFGEEEQTEQMLQVLNSNKIRDKLIEKYDLLSHYGIPDDAEFKMTRLYREYESDFNYRRTEYMAVKITFHSHKNSHQFEHYLGSHTYLQKFSVLWSKHPFWLRIHSTSHEHPFGSYV